MAVKKEKKAKRPKYQGTLDCNLQTYQISGETILDCLNSIQLNFMEIKTKGLISVTDGKRTASKFYQLRELKRLIASKVQKILQAKYLNTLLK